MKKEDLDKITEAIIGAAIAVHRELGPGLLESTYEACLEYELMERGLAVERRKELPVVDRLEKIHEAQLISYLKLSGKDVGLLINFNVMQLTQGVKRRVNEIEE